MLSLALIEDNTALREALVDVLIHEGFRVADYETAEAFWQAGTTETIDIMILDLELPGEDGIIVAERLSAGHPDIGIVMLTARDNADQRKLGYETGADIYLVKPSSSHELTAAIHAVSRRLKPRDVTDLSLAVNRTAMTIDGPAACISLSAWELELLIQFQSALDQRLEHQRIEELTDSPVKGRRAAIEVRLVRLRKKLVAAGASGQPIRAIRNWGYQLSVRLKIV